MAGSSPRISNDGAMDFIRPQLVKPIPHSVTKFVCDYDIDRIGKMLLAVGDRSLVGKMEAFKKNLESFKKPSAHGAIIDGDYEVDEYEDYEDDEVDEDGDEDDEVDEDEDVLVGDEKKPASDVGLQVRDEGEPECKKPRLSESFECQGLEEEIEA